MMQENATIEVQNLQYRQGRRTIIEDISFSVHPQERLAVLGINGSGKTTLLECILDINKVSGGQVRVGGDRITRHLDRIGIVWDQVELFPMLKVKEVIQYFKLLKGCKEFDQNLYDLLRLDDIREQQMKFLSRGERKKVCILIAMMNHPEFIFSDELSSDLDEQTLSVLWSNYLCYGKTIIFSTHKWHEAEKYATHLMFMHQGRMIMPPSSFNQIRQQYPFIYKVITELTEVPESLSSVPHYLEDGKVMLCVGEDTSSVAESLSRLGEYSAIPFHFLDLYNYLSFIQK